MKAMVYSEYGTPDVLSIAEVPKPSPSSKEILIQIHSCSINSWDGDMVHGTPKIYRLLFGIGKPKNPIIGCDIAGIVTEIGADVTEFQIGDEVYGDISDSWGGFAEYVVVKPNQVVKKPQHLTFSEAAAIPQAGALAYQALFDYATVNSGDQVLIIGAGGGIGSFAIPIAKELGAYVTAVDNADKQEALKSMGADEAYDYRKYDCLDGNKKYDLIIDIISHRSIWDYRKAMKPKGTAMILGGLVSSMLSFAFIGSLLSLLGSKKMKIVGLQINKGHAYISDLIQAKKLPVKIDRTYTLDNAVNAFRYFYENKFIGKIVVEMVGDSGGAPKAK